MTDDDQIERNKLAAERGWLITAHDQIAKGGSCRDRGDR